MPNPYSIPAAKWDGTLTDDEQVFTDEMLVKRDPSGAYVVRLLFDTFDLDPDNMPTGATLTLWITTIEDADGLCLTAGWDKRRPLHPSQYPSGGMVTDALDGVRLSTLRTGVRTIRLDNASGVNHCATGITLCIENTDVPPTGLNSLVIGDYEGGEPAILTLTYDVDGGGDDTWPDDTTTPDYTEDSEDDLDPDKPPKPGRATKLNTETAVLMGRLIAARQGPTIEYTTRLRATGSARVAQ